MQKLFSLAALFFLNTLFSSAQEMEAIRFSNIIIADDLRGYLSVLTSDSLEGRETGKEGQRKAARFIADHFETQQVAPGNKGEYLQAIALNKRALSGKSIEINDKTYYYLRDYFYVSGNPDTTLSCDSIVFVGYEKDLQSTKEKNKIVMVLGSGTDKNRTPFRGEATTLLIIEDSLQKRIDENVFKKIDKSEQSSVIYISKSMADSILVSTGKSISELKEKISETKKQQTFAFSAKTTIHILADTKTLVGLNVLGYIQGTTLKDEVLVISAHNDHLGKRDSLIYYGADDDGSGTTALMEIAKAFSIAKQQGQGPRRSILFLSCGGEEKGLLGSSWYTDHPVYPLKNTIADLNIDMIGRVDEKHKDTTDYVYLIGSDKLSTTLHRISEEQNFMHTHLYLDYTFNTPGDPNRFYYRSDHYNFAKHNIPIIFYFNGTHADYHKPTDTMEKINFELMAKRTKLVFFTAWKLANMDERPAVDVKNDFEEKKEKQ